MEASGFVFQFSSEEVLSKGLLRSAPDEEAFPRKYAKGIHKVETFRRKPMGKFHAVTVNQIFPDPNTFSSLRSIYIKVL